MLQKKLKNNAIVIVKKTIENYSMFKYGDSVLVSLSGGPDSVFLIHALLQLRDFYNLQIYCFHLDHMTRHGQSAEDAGFVEALCKNLGLKLFKEQVDAYKWCKQNRLSFQEGARIIRIGLLAETAKYNGIKKIAVGHTADDNLETFFINLLRGSGMRGLGGIRPVEKMFIRPIIECSRSEIKEYLDENNIQYCTDKTNIENIYLRNKVRNLLLPFIRKNIKIGFEKRILNTVKILRQEDKYLSELAEKYLDNEADFKIFSELNKYKQSGQKVLKKEKSNEIKQKNEPLKYFFSQESLQPEIAEIAIPLLGFSFLPDAFKRRILITAVNAIKGHSSDIKSKSLEDALKVMFLKGESKEITLADGIIIKKEYDLFKIYKKYPVKNSLYSRKSSRQYEIKPGKTIKAGNLGITVFSEIINRDEAKDRLSKKTLSFAYKKNKKAFPGNDRDKKNMPDLRAGQVKEKDSDIEVLLKENIDPKTEAYIDFDKICFPLFVRSWKKKEGESFIPFGMNEQKKLHDFFIDGKVPVSARIKIPIFSDAKKIIWAGGLRIDDRVKVQNGTKKILHIKIFNI